MGKSIDYAPIPQPEGGRISLSIKPPATWFGNEDFIVFVGGCGIGRARTLIAARKILLDAAKQSLESLIEKHQKAADHYRLVKSTMVLKAPAPKTPGG